jgi:hypothetical protein
MKFEGKATHRLHKKSPKKYPKNAFCTAGVTSLSLAIVFLTLPGASFGMPFDKTICFLAF